MDSTTTANEEHALASERPQCSADFDVVMWIVASVHAYQGRRRTAIGEHADQDQIRVVDPFKLFVELGLKPGTLEHIDTRRGHGEIRVELVRQVFIWMDVCYRRLSWVWICRNLDFLAKRGPMSSLAARISHLRRQNGTLNCLYSPSLQRARLRSQEPHLPSASSKWLSWILPPASSLTHGRRSVLVQAWKKTL